MMKTKVKNLSGEAVLLQSVSGGVVSNLMPGGKLLKDGRNYSILTPPNTTYREYWCVIGDPGPDGTTVNVILSSDDCAEFAEIELKSVEGVVRWDGKKPRNGVGVEDPSPHASVPPSSGAASTSPSLRAASPPAASRAESQGTKGSCSIQ